MASLNPYYLRSAFRFFLLDKFRPSYLIFFVTNKCEAHCRHCFYWKEINRETRELSIKEVDEFARKLGPMVQITITGGSPELRPDLPGIISSFVKYCSPMNITLCSNGNYPEILYATTKSILNDFNNLHLTVDISIDGLNSDHDQLRGIDGLFNRVKKSYFLLNDLKKEHRGLRLGCGLTVSGFNKEKASETAEWVINNLPVDNFTPILVRGEPRNNEALDVEPDVFMNIAGKVERLLKLGRLKGYSNFRYLVNSKDFIQKKIIYRIYKEQKPLIRCSALRETAVVYPDGFAGCCELRNEIMGNLRDYDMSLHRIWRNQKTLETRNSIKAGGCFCWHQCFLSAPIIKSPEMWKELVLNYLKQRR